MKDYIEERAAAIAHYIIEENATVRQTAKKFGVSKSTVHKDVTDRLLQINPALAVSARKVLDQNKSEEWRRGKNICTLRIDINRFGRHCKNIISREGY